MKPFINQYNWKEIDLMENRKEHRKDWKKFELNDKSMALNILYLTYNNEKIKDAYKSKSSNSFNDY